MYRRGFRLALLLAIVQVLCVIPSWAQVTYDVVSDFSTASVFNPGTALIRASDGNYYGTTNNGEEFGSGAVFRMTPQGIVTVLHSFNGTDGSLPYTPLVQGSDGNLYGSTAQGGSAGLGTFFKISTQGTFTHLHSIAGPDESSCFPEGLYPAAPLLEGSDGRFYSTISNGQNCGGKNFIFRVSTAGAFELLPLGSGGNSFSGLTRAADGRLYGLTYASETNPFGELFRITEAGDYEQLHAFSVEEGYFPLGELIQASDGLLYGTAYIGGAEYQGAIFRFDPVTLTHTTLHSFTANGAPGIGPAAGLVEGSDGWLYGTTHAGGAYNGGAIFRINRSTRAVETLHAFDSQTGFDPRGELIESSPGVWLGTTVFGGSWLNRGVVFRLTVPLCTLTLGYASGTLNLGFTLQSSTPATWSSWAVGSFGVANLWSIPIPAVSPAVSVNVPFPNVPPIGPIGILTILSTPAQGVMCFDWEVVDTGAASVAVRDLEPTLVTHAKALGVP
jgi:uncharacterized repeat protein (TIGR03803 family)